MKLSREAEVRSVLLPLADKTLLLPNAVVAEVIDNQTTEDKPDKQDWYLGDLSWRGVTIPLISMEMLLGGESASPSPDGKCVVLNTLTRRKELTHIAFHTQQVPSLVRVSAGNISVTEQEDSSDNILRHVEIQNQTALIPDLDALESQLVQK